jgi:hypothetical protein
VRRGYASPLEFTEVLGLALVRPLAHNLGAEPEPRAQPTRNLEVNGEA